MLRLLVKARDEAASALQFEEAANLHKMVARVKEIGKRKDELVCDARVFGGVALTKGAGERAFRLWPMVNGLWRNWREITVEENATPESIAGELQGWLPSVTTDLTESEDDPGEHLAILIRWYYSSWRDGSWYPLRPDRSVQLPACRPGHLADDEGRKGTKALVCDRVSAQDGGAAGAFRPTVRVLFPEWIAKNERSGRGRYNHLVKRRGKQRSVRIRLVLHLEQARAKAKNISKGGRVLVGSGYRVNGDLERAAEEHSAAGSGYRLKGLRTVYGLIHLGLEVTSEPGCWDCGGEPDIVHGSRLSDELLQLSIQRHPCRSVRNCLLQLCH